MTAQNEPAEFGRTLRALRWINGQADRKGFYAHVGVFPLLDYALPILPNQLLLIALAYLQRHRWFGLAVTFAVGSALGAFAIAIAVQLLGGSVADWLTKSAPTVGRVFDLVRDYGVWAVAALALLPTPPRTAVLLCALAGLAPLSIGLAVLGGRMFAATAIAWLSAHSPRHLTRVPGLGKVITTMEALRERSNREETEQKP